MAAGFILLSFLGCRHQSYEEDYGNRDQLTGVACHYTFPSVLEVNSSPAHIGITHPINNFGAKTPPTQEICLAVVYVNFIRQQRR